MAGSVVEIEARLPQIPPRESVELRAGDAFGKHRPRDGDMPLEHAREMVAQLFRCAPDDDGPRHIGGAVEILRAAVDEIDALADLQIALLRDPIMRDRRMFAEG